MTIAAGAIAGISAVEGVIGGVGDAIGGITGIFGGSNKDNELRDHYRWNQDAFNLGSAGDAFKREVATKYLAMRAGIMSGTTLPDIGFLDGRVAAGRTMGPWQHAESRTHAKQLHGALTAGAPAPAAPAPTPAPKTTGIAGALQQADATATSIQSLASTMEFMKWALLIGGVGVLALMVLRTRGR